MPDLSNFLGASVAGYSLDKVLSALATLLVCLIAVKLIMKLLTRLLSRMQKLGDRLCQAVTASFMSRKIMPSPSRPDSSIVK